MTAPLKPIESPDGPAGQSLGAAHGSAMREYKEDHRPPKGGWADGHYMNRCYRCGSGFIGDKRACLCADCAYGESPNEKGQR